MEDDGDDMDMPEGREFDMENNEPAAESSAVVKVQPSKRIVKNPRLKFNPERLCGERGIPVLVDHFKNVKFKGKGHEKEDLDKLLASLEHWTHRLFPSMKLQDCLHQIEKLGKKRPVQTCLRKIRLDMPILNSDFVKDDEEDDVQRNDDPDPEPPIMDAFDRLIEGSQGNLNLNVSSSENVEDNTAYSSPVLNNNNRGQVLGSSFGSSLTEEQKERMERNKLLAAERRKAKFAAKQPNTTDSESTHINVTSPQDMSTTFEALLKSSDSAVDSQASTADKRDTSRMEIDDDNLDKSSSLCLDNQNSENLGLDDLIDLVDEDESVPVKNITEQPCNASRSLDKDNTEESEISLEDTVPINVSSSNADLNLVSTLNIVETGNSESSNISEKLNTELLDLESMMDLVEENKSASDKNATFETPEQLGSMRNNFNTENMEENEISLEDTVPVGISSSNTSLNIDSIVNILEH